MKFTRYRQLKNANQEELATLSIDNYTDDELKQIESWLTEAELETLFESQDCISGLSEAEKKWLKLNDCIVSETTENTSFAINGKTVNGKIVARYPEFYIIKEDMNDRYFKVDTSIWLAIACC